MIILSRIKEEIVKLFQNLQGDQTFTNKFLSYFANKKSLGAKELKEKAIKRLIFDDVVQRCTSFSSHYKWNVNFKE